jgi:hypothetical protein
VARTAIRHAKTRRPETLPRIPTDHKKQNLTHLFYTCPLFYTPLPAFAFDFHGSPAVSQIDSHFVMRANKFKYQRVRLPCEKQAQFDSGAALIHAVTHFTDSAPAMQMGLPKRRCRKYHGLKYALAFASITFLHPPSKCR